MQYAVATSVVEVQCLYDARDLPGWARSRLCPLCVGVADAGEDGLICVSIDDPVVTEVCAACKTLAAVVFIEVEIHAEHDGRCPVHGDRCG